MSSILDLGADASSDENDGDYVPPTGVPSDSSAEEDSFDEDLESDQKPQSRRGKRSTKQNKKPESEIAPTMPPVDEKKRAENIWLDFLSDVSKNAPEKKPCTHEFVKPCTHEFVKPCTHEFVAVPKIGTTKTAEHTKFSNNPEKSKPAEVFEFAGETFTVSNESELGCGLKNMDKCIKEPTSAKGNSETSGSVTPVSLLKKRGGLESVLGSISNKKKKLTTLEKTLYDWKTFKKDEGLDEDLEKFNKGKGGFIERQRFLQRSDVRSFEVEKSVRQSKRKM